ncbi:hypothetical protein [Nannocystis pusilla]|uniref:Uncharacterized protein n=1 Tax=Nannocystis pusilla TaxID=889268 RepID=A0ABS7TNF5_9BACT|nr:hypothetical protein [Nannocystis pusilla]MBZ5709762.1 hypothetical protein [Nannocystis pusilla]
MKHERADREGWRRGPEGLPPTRRWTPALTVVAGAFLSQAACLPQFEQIEGERVLYEHSASLQACAGNVDHMDAAVALTETMLGVRAPAPLRYSWLAKEDIPRSRRKWVAQGLEGEGLGLHAWALAPAEVHELVHLVAQGDNAPPFFLEGLAVALSGFDDNPTLGGLLGDSDPRPNMAASSTIEVDYLTAGRFVKFLLLRHGPNPFMRFYHMGYPPHTMRKIRANFARAYGRSLDDEVDEYRVSQTASCDSIRHDVVPFACLGPVVAREGNAWTIDADMDCDSTHFVGGVAHERLEGWMDYTVNIDVPGRHYVQVETADSEVEPEINFGPCFACPESFSGNFDPDDSQVPRQLAAGLHYIRVHAFDSSVRVTIRRIASQPQG